MQIVVSTLKVIGYLALALFVIYALFIDDNKSMSGIAYGILVFVAYNWWEETQNAAKKRLDERFQTLVERTAYLERKLAKLEGGQFALEERVESIEKCASGAD
ncbi:hypothetical protein [Bradyrhizobium oligotrophicum]|uniref:hypothetical protein n=1 Tax=Bradyrhizobium oligotrophicum TaxID=44255 RepID=UPI003EBDF0B5